ncbi:MAG: ATP-binding protein [Clostridia bacterium]|nr:ATP-binding protein [Clostridia bacterium]
MKNRIFVNMRAMVIGSVLACCMLLLVVLYGFFARQMEAELDAYVDLISSGLNQPGMTAALRTGLLDAAAADVRVTLISVEGGVLYESQADSASMENHLERKEIQQALHTGSGEDTRMSQTLDELTVYRARRLADGTVLRVSRNRQSVLGLLGRLITFFGLAFILTSILSVVLASRITDRIVQPINEIDIVHPENNHVYEELNPLLRRMADQNRRLDASMRELAARRNEFEAITDHMTEGLIVLNRHSEILSVNAAAVRIFSADSGLPEVMELEGKSVRLLSRAEELSFVVEGALGGASVSEVLRLAGRYFRLIGNPVRSGEEVTGAVLLAMDVNDVYLAEQSRREFTANVSHELKTPITAVMGYAEIMKNGLVPADQVAEFSGRIFDEATRLKQLVEDIIHLSRLEEPAEQERVRVDLLELAQDAKERLERQAEARDVTVSVCGRPVSVFGAREMLEEMALNLLDNAIKYNRQGGSVTVEVGEAEGRAHFRVSDTGIGIDAQYHDRIFERFFRVDKSRSRQVGGTGLGLSIVKHAAAYHHAKIDVNSAPSCGTTIQVTF